jgi:hypothetical protein
MKTETIYIYGKDTAAITCEACGRSKRIDVSGIKNIRIPRRVNCPCGASFHVLFDRRRHYRKEVMLMGQYSKANRMEPEAILVTDLSQIGMRFQGLSRDLKEVEAIKGLNQGDVLYAEFRLDNNAKSLIRSKAIVRHVYKGCVGADFSGNDEHIKRELGFYMMP